jgi:hypothetical protein
MSIFDMCTISVTLPKFMVVLLILLTLTCAVESLVNDTIIHECMTEEY